jgi:predicted anti-sigma-YlaC factor YlaD
MRLVRHISNACDRAREWSSLAVDGELSGFERALLDAHLERCEDCRVFRAGVTDATALLRASSPERPSRPIAIPGRARPRTPSVRNVLALAAAASIFVTAGLFGAMHSLGTGSQPLLRQRPVHQSLPLNADLLQQKRARRTQLVVVTHFPTAGFGGPQLPSFVTS